MAVKVMVRRLSNPARRRRPAATRARKNPAKRKLSVAQIKFFGTPRQKAALRAKRTRNAGKFSVRKTLKRKRKSYAGSLGGMRARLKKHGGSQAKPRAKRRKNVGEIVSIALAGLNPGKKRSTRTMARRRKARKSTAVATRRRVSRRRKNPGVARRRRVSHRAPVARRLRRRSNPMFRVRRVRRISRRRNSGRRNPGFMSGGLLTKAIGVITGAVASKYLTQLVLGGNNTSYIGYAGNLAATFGLHYAAKKITKSKDIADGVLLGGVVALVLRVVADKTPIGQYVNASLAGMGKAGDTGIGIISDSSFYLPQTFKNGSMTDPNVPRAITSYVGSQMSQAATMKAAGSPGMGSMRGRRARGVL